MENNTINLKDEYGNNLKGQVLNIIEIDEIDYLLYSVSTSPEEDSLYVKKIIKDENGEDDLVDITNEEEKEKVFSIIKEYINSIE